MKSELLQMYSEIRDVELVNEIKNTICCSHSISVEISVLNVEQNEKLVREFF